MKTLEQNFQDWEGNVFGFGYGSGEPHTVPALKKFLSLCEAPNGSYDYNVLERELTPAVAWLLMNALGHADIIEYGTSPRFGWLTEKGRALKEFTDARDEDTLIELATSRTEDDMPCSPGACNCGPNGYQAGVKCVNPFWGHKALS